MRLTLYRPCLFAAPLLYAKQIDEEAASLTDAHTWHGTVLAKPRQPGTVEDSGT